MTSVSKNIYIDKLHNIANKYNNTFHSAIKMKPVDVKSNTYIGYSKRLIIKTQNLKLVILLEYRNIKTLFCKRIYSELVWEVFVNKKVKNTVLWTYVISNLKGKEIVQTFYENQLQKTNIKNLELKN